MTHNLTYKIMRTLTLISIVLMLNILTEIRADDEHGNIGIVSQIYVLSVSKF